MSAETDLDTLLATLEPEQRPGTYVFVTVDSAPPGVEVSASVVEPEGLTLVITRQDADRAELPYDYLAAWITLRVHSSLAAVGLTAAVSTTLAAANISCNVLAGHHHDHLLVPVERASDALALLQELADR